MRRLPPESPFGLDIRNKRRNRGVPKKVEQSGKWPQQACTTMFFLIPKNVSSERPIRWWEALRAPEEAKWQQRYRMEWDTTDGRNGRAQQTEEEVLDK